MHTLSTIHTALHESLGIATLLAAFIAIALHVAWRPSRSSRRGADYRTFRFVEIPTEMGKDDFLMAINDSTGIEASALQNARQSVRSYSFTKSIEDSSKWNTATVCFDFLPSSLESLLSSPGKRTARLNRLHLPGHDFCVQIDEDFMGLTPLYWPDEYDVEYEAF